MADFLSVINKQTILADGAMGTMLNARGISFERCFDELNLVDPDVVADIHREFIRAGSRLILTNTFSANRFKLAKFGLEEKLPGINRAGVELARKALDADFEVQVFIAGDVGPLGVRLAPYGRIQPEQAQAAFGEQVRELAAAGADLVVIETMSDVQEAVQAVKAARLACSLPVVASVTFTRDDRTILGDSPEGAARSLVDAGADVIGVNCSGGPAQLLRLLRMMHQAVPAAKLWVKPNAGWPEQVAGRIMYPADAQYFGDYALAFRAAGAAVIGGCCGTTPAHIASMRQALDASMQEPPDQQPAEMIESVEVPAVEAQLSHLASRIKSGEFVFSVEMDPPRGLSTHKLIAGASLLQEAGADVIDVADSPMARMRMSAWAVCDVIQHRVGVETSLHFPTRGRNLLRVQGDLLAAHALGIRNVFIVMGDPTSIGDYPEAANNYDIVPSGLIKLIKQGFNAGLDHAGISIGQPTSFFVGAALNLQPANAVQEYRNTHRKVRAGVDFFLTQPVYDPEAAWKFLEGYAREYGSLEPAVIAGILPLSSTRHASFLHHEVPGIHIPEQLLRRMERAGENGAKEGIRIAVELAQQVKEWGQGIYLMPQFNRFDVVAEIIEAIK